MQSKRAARGVSSTGVRRPELGAPFLGYSAVGGVLLPPNLEDAASDEALPSCRVPTYAFEASSRGFTAEGTRRVSLDRISNVLASRCHLSYREPTSRHHLRHFMHHLCMSWQDAGLQSGP